MRPGSSRSRSVCTAWRTLAAPPRPAAGQKTSCSSSSGTARPRSAARYLRTRPGRWLSQSEASGPAAGLEPRPAQREHPQDAGLLRPPRRHPRPAAGSPRRRRRRRPAWRRASRRCRPRAARARSASPPRERARRVTQPSARPPPGRRQPSSSQQRAPVPPGPEHAPPPRVAAPRPARRRRAPASPTGSAANTPAHGARRGGGAPRAREGEIGVVSGGEGNVHRSILAGSGAHLVVVRRDSVPADAPVSHPNMCPRHTT